MPCTSLYYWLLVSGVFANFLLESQRGPSSSGTSASEAVKECQLVRAIEVNEGVSAATLLAKLVSWVVYAQLSVINM